MTGAPPLCCLGHSSVSGSVFPVSLSSASPVEVRPLSVPMCPLSLCASSLWLFALFSVRFIWLKSLSLSCVSCFILKVPGVFPLCCVLSGPSHSTSYFVFAS